MEEVYSHGVLGLGYDVGTAGRRQAGVFGCKFLVTERARLGIPRH